MPRVRKPIDELVKGSGVDKDLKNISVAIPTGDLKIIDLLMEKKAISRCEIFRRAVDLYIKTEIPMEKQKEKIVEEYDAVQLYMQENGYNHIRRLE